MNLSEKYRPKTFDEMIGHETVIASLINALTLPDPSRVYLISGSFGVGKTTLAKIFINILEPNPVDIIEQNLRVIDDARNITELCSFPPIGDCRIFILDEFHHLGKAGADHLLKILEFPGEGDWFFLCSSEPDKIKSAINFQRAQHIHLHNLNESDMLRVLERVSSGEGWEIPQNIQLALVQWAQGSPRRLMKGLELCYALTDIDDVNRVLGTIQLEINENQILYQLIKAISEDIITDSIWKSFISLVEAEDLDPETVRQQIIGFIGSKMKYSKINDLHQWFKKMEILTSFQNLESNKVGRAELYYMIGLIAHG